ncbi:MAG: hypothetical protein V3V14_08845 [Saprospiraceae bacterium]
MRKIIIGVLVVLGLFGLWKITRNIVDPIWINLEQLDYSKIKTLDNSHNNIQSLFNDFHNNTIGKKTDAVELISDPYMPIMEFSKFELYIKALKNERRIVISGVSGNGATTLISKLAKFIAIDDLRITNLICTPQFDLIYNKELIGEKVDGKFRKGKLLKFWEECLAHPENKYIAIFDDIDKVNPETIFGSDLWENLFNPKYKQFINGEEVVIPDNFYMISSTLSAIGSRNQLHNEHFERIGRVYYLMPNTIEMALYLNRKKEKLNNKIAKNGIESLEKRDRIEIEVLNDKKNIIEYLYTFQKTNQIIEEKINKNCQLAQWSTLRKYYYPKDKEKLHNTFISHVNAFSPDMIFEKKDLNPVFYAIKNNGLMPKSNKLALWFKVFKEWGFLTEFVVAICFALITALLSIYFNTKRKKQVTIFLTRSETIYSNYENRELDSDAALFKLSELKGEIELHTKNNKISFPEAIFFHNSVRSKVNSIEISKNINATFLILMDVFLEDGILSKNEYTKLMSFLNKIENNIPKKDYFKMKETVIAAWDNFGDK